MSTVDRKAIRRDPWMQRFMKTGIPIALISVLSLWLGQWLRSPALGKLFIVTAAITVVIGMIYNVRFVILAVRQLKAQQQDHK